MPSPDSFIAVAIVFGLACVAGIITRGRWSIRVALWLAGTGVALDSWVRANLTILGTSIAIPYAIFSPRIFGPAQAPTLRARLLVSLVTITTGGLLIATRAILRGELAGSGGEPIPIWPDIAIGIGCVVTCFGLLAVVPWALRHIPHAPAR